jgi:hypothetical protein
MKAARSDFFEEASMIPPEDCGSKRSKRGSGTRADRSRAKKLIVRH